MNISLLLVFLAGVFNAAMYSVRIHYKKSIFAKWFPKQKKFFDENISWRNKYVNGDRNKGPKFLFSTNFLSWLTDFYNLSFFIMIILLLLTIPFYKPWLGGFDVVIYYLVFSISSEIFKRIFIRKSYRRT